MRPFGHLQAVGRQHQFGARALDLLGHGADRGAALGRLAVQGRE